MTPLIEVEGVSKYFGQVIALKDISMSVDAGEVLCLLGDNGAGKSTLIKTLSGVHRHDEGRMLIEGEEVKFNSPRDALDRGIATVFQDLAMIPLMGISRNFFLGREPTKGFGPFKRYDAAHADRVTREEMQGMGIDIRDPSQPVGTLSGGERQSVAIARAVHFGAKVLILDEPTSALGVKQAAVVLRYIAKTRELRQERGDARGGRLDDGRRRGHGDPLGRARRVRANRRRRGPPRGRHARTPRRRPPGRGDTRAGEVLTPGATTESRCEA